MNELASLGVILLFALLAGHLVKFLKIPEVTGYILAGVFVGPSVLGWVTHENLSTLEVFSEVALGLILFSIGAVFEFSRLRRYGRRALCITLTESILAALLVATGAILCGQPWQVALLLGTVAMETAAASTLMVIRECNAEGDLTETLSGVIALNNVFCLVGFSIVAAAIDLQTKSHAHVGLRTALHESLYPMLWQLVGSVALGILIGVLLASWASRVVEQGETLILLAGSVLLCVGISRVLDLSPLVSSLAVGAAMVNISGKGRRLFDALSHTGPPLYAIFFVIAGADLNLALLPSLGLLGVLYIAGRCAGKYLGASFSARLLGLQRSTRELLGLSMLAQAGLAIGLVFVIHERFAQYASVVNTVVLGAVGIFELVGPISARFALIRSGEARPLPAETAVL